MKETKKDTMLFEKYINNCFVDIEHSIPRFQQELFDLQNEYYKMWKNITISNIVLQKQINNKMGLANQIPQAYQKIVETMIQEAVKLSLVRNQTYTTWIDTTKKNIKMLSSNLEMLMENWKKIIDFWIYTPKKK